MIINDFLMFVVQFIITVVIITVSFRFLAKEDIMSGVVRVGGGGGG